MYAKGFGVLVLFGLIVLMVMPTCCENTVRPKLSRARTDMHVIAIALEAYFGDHKSYPPMTSTVVVAKTPGWFARTEKKTMSTFETGGRGGAAGLMKPVAYMKNSLVDPFADGPYRYFTSGTAWLLYSAGPDGHVDISNPERSYDGKKDEMSTASLMLATYDPTNGTESSGDVWRIKL
jgi:hypothetical protein